MTDTIRQNYEVSSEGAVRHWEFTKTRLEDTTPVKGQPFALLSLTAGKQLCGTVLVSDTGDTKIVGDVTHSMVYWQEVRNVRTYSGAAENTWGAINEGDRIYYDRSSTMPAGVKLSTSPLDKDGGENPMFGYAVLRDDDDTLPKGSTTASTQEVAVLQVAGGDR